MRDERMPSMGMEIVRMAHSLLLAGDPDGKK